MNIKVKKLNFLQYLNLSNISNLVISKVYIKNNRKFQLGKCLKELGMNYNLYKHILLQIKQDQLDIKYNQSLKVQNRLNIKDCIQK